MAFILPYSMDNGVTVTYWRITSVQVSSVGLPQVKIAGYINQQMRDDGKSFVVEYTYTLGIGTVGLWDTTGSSVYAALKAHTPPIVMHDAKPYFGSAVDI